MTGKWTPGPWKVGQLASYDGGSGVPFRCVYRGDNETAHTRIYVWGGDRTEESDIEFDCDADARLIAAAPTMFDALEAAEACLSIVPPRSDTRAYLETLETVRAALTKATGEGT